MECEAAWQWASDHQGGLGVVAVFRSTPRCDALSRKYSVARILMMPRVKLNLSMSLTRKGFFSSCAKCCRRGVASLPVTNLRALLRIPSPTSFRDPSMAVRRARRPAVAHYNTRAVITAMCSCWLLLLVLFARIARLTQGTWRTQEMPVVTAQRAPKACCLRAAATHLCISGRL